MSNGALEALHARFEAARKHTDENGHSADFNDLEALIEKESAVVVSMPAGVARKLFEEPNTLYANYETLVGANVRKPAESKNDRHRCTVGALLFGTYARRIMYGVLSLTQEGLPTYGNVYCGLGGFIRSNGP